MQLSNNPSTVYGSYFLRIRRQKRVSLILSICFIVAVSIFLPACQQANHKLPQEVAKDLPTDFVAFYDKFHADSAYQMAHIQFPLEGYPSGNMADSVDINQFRWTVENWAMHRAANFTDSLFKRQFEIPMPNVVNETILQKNTQYGTYRRFLKRGEDWFLIFYSDVNKIEEK
jgi:hypothetical protein